MKRINLLGIIAAIFAITSLTTMVYAAGIKMETPSTAQPLETQAPVGVLLEGLTESDIELLQASGTAFTLEFQSGLEIVPGSMESSYFDLFETQFNAAGTDPNPYTGRVDGYDQPLVVNNEAENSRTRVAAARCTPTSNSTDDKLASFKVQLSNPKTAGTYSITLKPTVLNNPSAGYEVDTAIDVLVGSDPTKEATETDAYPVLIASDMTPIVATVVFGGSPIVDIDEDTMDDNWENDNFGDLLTAEAGTDFDKDGYQDTVEYAYNYNPKVMDEPGKPGYDESTDCRASSPWTKKTGSLNNLSLYGVVYFGDEYAPENSYIAAFGPGGETDCREIVKVGSNGSYFMTIVGDSNGDEITFKLKSYADCQIYDISEKFTFVADSSTEKDLHISTSSTIEINFVAGWNWVSFNVMPDDTSLDTFFGENTAKVKEVKTQTESAINRGTMWIGSNTGLLSNIANGAMFKIKADEDFTLSVTGTPVDQGASISLNLGWTWIGFTPSDCIAVRNAVDSVFDILKEVKSQTESRIKVGENFFGTLNEMCPGKGYAIKVTEQSAITYVQQ